MISENLQQNDKIYTMVWCIPQKFNKAWYLCNPRVLMPQFMNSESKNRWSEGTFLLIIKYYLTCLYEFQYYYFITIMILEVCVRWNYVIISKIGQGHKHFHCEWSMLLERKGTVLCLDKNLWGKQYGQII